MDLELGGKTVLVTGGTDGLGLALATHLAAEGAAVAVCGRDEERLRATEAAVQAVGGCAPDAARPAALADQSGRRALHVGAFGQDTRRVE